MVDLKKLGWSDVQNMSELLPKVTRQTTGLLYRMDPDEAHLIEQLERRFLATGTDGQVVTFGLEPEQAITDQAWVDLVLHEVPDRDIDISELESFGVGELRARLKGTVSPLPRTKPALLATAVEVASAAPSRRSARLLGETHGATDPVLVVPLGEGGHRGEMERLLTAENLVVEGIINPLTESTNGLAIRTLEKT